MEFGESAGLDRDDRLPECASPEERETARARKTSSIHRAGPRPDYKPEGDLSKLGRPILPKELLIHLDRGQKYGDYEHEPPQVLL
jgi:hypothetical protein